MFSDHNPITLPLQSGLFQKVRFSRPPLGQLCRALRGAEPGGIHLLLYTGMRRGELCGLEWRNIDFDSEVIHIRRSALYLPEKGVFLDETKNDSSQRSIKAPSAAMKLLRMFRAWQSE